MGNPYAVIGEFEKELCAYTGAPYAVAVNSCTMALLLSVAYCKKTYGESPVEVPKFTYVGVPQAVIHGGCNVEFVDLDWLGYYRMPPYPIWDSARYFEKGMFGKFSNVDFAPLVCVSFHASKILGLEQGGAILHNSAVADKWFRKARFDARTENVAPRDDTFDMLGWHCLLNPSTAAQGILRIYSLPEKNAPLPNSDYADLSKIEAFK
jgi:dTDP-4-amino-4,6-dideoxygalactose transaminase